jgi:hypothetical protein
MAAARSGVAWWILETAQQQGIDPSCVEVRDLFVYPYLQHVTHKRIDGT